MAADDWVEQGRSGSGCGRRHICKIRSRHFNRRSAKLFLKSMPMELTYADSNNQFLYYNKKNGC